MQYVDTPASSPPSTLILVHGSWHDGRSWSAVQEQPAAVGVRDSADLPGHGACDDRLAVSHDDYVSAVIAELDSGRDLWCSSVTASWEHRDESTLAQIRAMLVRAGCANPG
jgi:hypothetical protein